MSSRNAGLHNKSKTGLQYEPERKEIAVLHKGVGRDVRPWYLVRQHQELA